jgi:hypothetical protein
MTVLLLENNLLDTQSGDNLLSQNLNDIVTTRKVNTPFPLFTLVPLHLQLLPYHRTLVCQNRNCYLLLQIVLDVLISMWAFVDDRWRRKYSILTFFALGASYTALILYRPPMCTLTLGCKPSFVLMEFRRQ